MELMLHKNYELINADEAKQIVGGGQIGFRVYISDKVRSAGAMAGGAAVTAAVAAALAAAGVSVAGPVGAAVGAGIGTLCYDVTKKAIENHWEYCDITYRTFLPGDKIITLHV